MSSFEGIWSYSETASTGASASFVAVITDSKPKKYISIYNGWDTGAYVGFDGSNVAIYIPPGDTKTPVVPEGALYVSGRVYLKYETAPSSGKVYITTASVDVQSGIGI